MLNASTTYGANARPNTSAFEPADSGAMGISRNRKALLFLLLVFASAEFVARGPLRIVRRASNGNDFSAPYVGAKAWVKGLNPYSSSVFLSLWEQPAAQDSSKLGSSGTRTPYPLTCLVLLTPFAFFSWPTASAVFGLFLSIAVVIALLLLSGLPELRESAWRKWLFLGLALALAPVHTGIGQDNVSVLSIVFMLLSFWSFRTQRPMLAGVCCGAAIALKPQLGLFLLFYYLLSRQWRAFGVSLASTFVIAVVAIGRIHILGWSWLPAYLANNKQTLADPVNSFTAENWRRFQMVNLQVLWYAVTKNPHAANFLALLVTLGLLLAGVLLLIKKEPSIHSIVGVSFLAMICLLPVYHRNYDAALLIFPLLWSLSPAPPQVHVHQRLALILMAPFAVPGAWMLESMQNAGRLPHYLTAAWWWDPVVMSHQVWALLLLAVLLLSVMWQQQRAPDLGNGIDSGSA
jgi:hypothetical protein